MSNTRFELDTSSVRTEILQADWMLQHVESVAQSQCDSESHVKSFVGFDRAKAIIYPNTEDYPE